MVLKAVFYIHLVLNNSIKFKLIHSQRVQTNLVRSCSCPYKHTEALWFSISHSCLWNHVWEQAIEGRLVVGICMRVIMQFGRVEKQFQETSQVVKKLIPGSDGDNHKSTTLPLLKEILWMWVAVTAPRHQPRPWLYVSGIAQSTAVKSTVGGNVNWCIHHGEQYLEVRQKTKNRGARWSCNSTPGYIPGENHNQKRYMYSNGHWSTISWRHGSNLNCSWTNEWIQMWYKYTMEYYSAIEQNEIMPFAVIWMNLETI